MSLHPYLNTAVTAARSAGRIITRAVDRIDRLEVNTKSAFNDLVTSADKASEEEIISIIRKAYPDHGILGEESGSMPGTNINEVEWIIDPIDGTLNFVHGYPYFCVSIGIKIRGVVQHGLVFNPMSNELFTASKGHGAQLDGRRIRVSSCTSLDQAIVSPIFAFRRSGDGIAKCLEKLQLIMEKVAGIRRCGAAALDLANVAAGRLDGFWEVGLGPWDVAAGALLVQEAGGFVADLSGGDEYMDKGRIIAASPKIFNELLQMVRD